ncbi:hypothetical protein A2335_03415, partial [Candidatus Peregrinibacteria bacterium RIFOXYB2_FULL_32_7]
LWGSQYLWVAKIGYAVPPFAFAALRFFLAGMVLLFFNWKIFAKTEIKMKKNHLMKILTLSVLGLFVGTMAMIFGVNLANTVVVSTVININSVLVIFLASILIGEKIKTFQKIGIFIAFLGIVLIALNGQSFTALTESEYFFGALIAFVAAFFISFYTIYIKQYVEKYGGLTVTQLGLMPACFLGFIISMFFENWDFVFDLSFVQWLYIVLFGVITGLTFSLWASSIKHLGSSGAASFKIGIPFFATIYSLLFLNEKLTIWIFLGLILVISGMLMCHLGKISKKKKGDVVFEYEEF